MTICIETCYFFLGKLIIEHFFFTLATWKSNTSFKNSAVPIVWEISAFVSGCSSLKSVILKLYLFIICSSSSNVLKIVWMPELLFLAEIFRRFAENPKLVCNNSFKCQLFLLPNWKSQTIFFLRNFQRRVRFVLKIKDWFSQNLTEDLQNCQLWRNFLVSCGFLM